MIKYSAAEIWSKIHLEIKDKPGLTLFQRNTKTRYSGDIVITVLRFLLVCIDSIMLLLSK